MKIYDLETDNLLDKVTTIWCAWTYDTRTEKYQGYLRSDLLHHDPDARDVGQLWMDLADDEDGCVAHNGLDYDLEVLRKFYGHIPEFMEWYNKCHDEIGTYFLDTLILGRLLYPDVGAMDWAMYKTGKLKGFPDTPAARKKLFGNHNLEAWGYRLGVNKLKPQDEDGPMDWGTFTVGMYNPYNKQDVAVTGAALQRFEWKAGQLSNSMCVALEHRFALYLKHQMDAGVSFDTEKSELLLKYWKRELSKRLFEMKAQVPDIIIEEDFIPKRDNKTRGYKAGEVFVKRSTIPFNPKSADHVIMFLTEKYNWEPTEFTSKKSDKWPNGKPQITHAVLNELPYPECKLLARIKLLMDRIALVQTSPASWLKSINEVTGRIHGRIIHNGTPTSRCRHSRPNLGNVPSPKATWGLVLRSLFRAQDGWDLVGCDADGLEMRLLSHALYPFDGGAFFDAAFNGSKEEGTDCHSKNMNAIIAQLIGIGCPELAAVVDRDMSKTIFYAILYGAFPKKVAQILIKMGGVAIPKQRQYAIGQVLMNAIRDAVPGLESLIESLEDIYEEAEHTGRWPHLFMPDGRPAPIRSKHAILNTLNQTTGAVVMKVALVLFWDKMEEHGLKIRVDWNPLLFVHDELQVETRPGTVLVDGAEVRISELTGRLAAEAIKTAGEVLGLRVPLVGSAAIGKTWKDTH